MVLGAREKKLQEQEVQNTKRYNREGNVTKEIELDKKINKIGPIFHLCYLAIISCLYKASVTRFYLQ